MIRNTMISFFWVFISIILTFQLLTGDGYDISQAIAYSVIITGTFAIYVLLLSRYLIRKYIRTKKIIFFVFCVFLLSIVASLILTFEDYALESSFDANWDTRRESVLPQFFGMWMATILISGIAYAFELYQHHIETLESTQLLKISLNELEVKSIRQQLSPHFTFNILNNLQFLIQKDQGKALNLLAQYSKILRYYVYESQNKAILLNDEILFLKTYLELEKDSLKEDAIVEIDFSIEPNELKIAPFILSTFVENAFKHLSLKRKWVSVRISTINNNLLMHVQNSCTLGEDLMSNPTGVGLELVKKRLELIYSGKYLLEYQKESGVFSVELRLNFA